MTTEELIKRLRDTQSNDYSDACKSADLIEQQAAKLKIAVEALYSIAFLDNDGKADCKISQEALAKLQEE